MHGTTNVKILILSGSWLAIRSSNSGGGKKDFSSPQPPHRLWGPTSVLFHRYRGSFSAENRSGFEVTTHLQLVSRLRMNGDVTPLPPHAFMAWKGTTLRLPLIGTMSANWSESLCISYNHCAPFVHLVSSMSMRGRNPSIFLDPFNVIFGKV
jgi:hypothetical protein